MRGFGGKSPPFRATLFALRKQIFLRNFFFYQNFLYAKFFLTPKIFLRKKFCYTNFFDQKFFLRKIFLVLARYGGRHYEDKSRVYLLPPDCQVKPITTTNASCRSRVSFPADSGRLFSPHGMLLRSYSGPLLPLAKCLPVSRK